MNSAKFQSRLDQLNSNVWGYALNVPTDIARQFIEGHNKRVICSINGIEPFKCGLIGGADGNFILVLNKKRRNKLEKMDISVFDVSLEKDTSEIGMDVSAEFIEVMSQYEEASDFFDSLTPGKKRTLIYWADNVKSSEIKIRRAIVLCEHLIQENGVPDFRKMNEEVKAANARYKRGASI
ncbi:YdeI/OmpD-associated family protein [Salibacteraceae bacterium]|nr:YdeI/OmpD-associated family protein [Salibacteraceae bacterium]